jgi:hypothetical protein
LVLTVGQKAQIESVACSHVEVYLKASPDVAENGTAELESYDETVNGADPECLQT